MRLKIFMVSSYTMSTVFLSDARDEMGLPVMSTQANNSKIEISGKANAAIKETTSRQMCQE